MTTSIPPAFVRDARGSSVGSSPFLATAISLGEQLVAEAVPAAGGLTWEGDDLLGDETNYTVVHGPVGPDLYGGTAGIAWFLGHLAAETSSADLAQTAVGGLHFAVAEAAARLDQRTISLYAGATGVAVAAAETADRLNLPDLKESALALAKRVVDTVGASPPIEEIDLIGGVAGVTIGLLSLYRLCGDVAMLDACREACWRIVGRGRRDWWGCSWPNAEAMPALCGLGHGMSGIGWALAETGRASGEASLLSAAEEAFRYERSWFSQERCAWPDLRQPTSESVENDIWPAWTTAWCHGALGIGAVRLRLYEVGRDLAALAEASAAIQAARSLVVQSASDLQQGLASDVTLCHGLGGVIELLLLADEVLGLPDHRRAAMRVGDLCLRIFEANGQRWTFGLRQAERVPGLFLGLAGIGVTMMRLHDSSSIGSPVLPGRPRKSRGSKLPAPYHQ